MLLVTPLQKMSSVEVEFIFNWRLSSSEWLFSTLAVECSDAEDLCHGALAGETYLFSFFFFFFFFFFSGLLPFFVAPCSFSSRSFSSRALVSNMSSPQGIKKLLSCPLASSLKVSFR